MLKDGVLYKINYHGIYLRCLEKEEAHKVLEEFHNREGGTSHTSGNALAHQILRVGYYWSFLSEMHITMQRLVMIAKPQPEGKSFQAWPYSQSWNPSHSPRRDWIS